MAQPQKQESPGILGKGILGKIFNGVSLYGISNLIGLGVKTLCTALFPKLAMTAIVTSPLFPLIAGAAVIGAFYCVDKAFNEGKMFKKLGDYREAVREKYGTKGLLAPYAVSIMSALAIGDFSGFINNGVQSLEFLGVPRVVDYIRGYNIRREQDKGDGGPDNTRGGPAIAYSSFPQ